MCESLQPRWEEPWVPALNSGSGGGGGRACSLRRPPALGDLRGRRFTRGEYCKVSVPAHGWEPPGLLVFTPFLSVPLGDLAKFRRDTAEVLCFPKGVFPAPLTPRPFQGGVTAAVEGSPAGRGGGPAGRPVPPAPPPSALAAGPSPPGSKQAR